jgi:hypothetical protein
MCIFCKSLYVLLSFLMRKGPGNDYDKWNISVMSDLMWYITYISLLSLFFSECFYFPKHFKLLLLCLPLGNQSIFNLLPTLPEHLSLLPVFSGVRAIRSLVLCVYFVNRCMSFCPFSLVLCVLFRFTDSDYLFGI